MNNLLRRSKVSQKDCEDSLTTDEQFETGENRRQEFENLYLNVKGDLMDLQYQYSTAITKSGSNYGIFSIQ